jgi:hypothetical protein
MMIWKAACVLAVAGTFLLVGCGSDDGDSGSNGGDSLTVNLRPQNQSGESGTATLTADGDRTMVVINLESKSAKPATEAQPAHIHRGTCADLNVVPALPLEDVRAGESTTTVNAKLDVLREDGYAINVHKSAQQSEIYVACGDIGKGENDASSPPGYDKESDY